MSQLHGLIEEVGVALSGPYQFDKDIYILKADKTAAGNALEMANYLHETGLFAFSEPNFWMENTATCITEPDYHMQWHLQSTGSHLNPGVPGGVFNTAVGIGVNPTCAWDEGYSGQGIRVAVIDDGIVMHPDLNNIAPGFAANGTPIAPFGIFPPGFPGGEHGTACAGIIGANCNNYGPTGVAFNATIVPVITSGLTQGNFTIKASAIDWAWNQGACDVLNLSWKSAYSNLIQNALANAVNLGRNGLGSVVVASSGNDYGQVAFPGASGYTISVGATTTWDFKAVYSNFGPQLDMVAPGEYIVTTDIPGMWGYNGISGIGDPNFHYTFNGTSAAAPIVSGAVALMLEANPQLKQYQVRNILLSHCDKPNYSFFTDPNKPLGLWSYELGYGRLDICNFWTQDILFNPGTRLANSVQSLEPSLFPNPAQDRVTIKWPEELGTAVTLELFDLSGKLIQHTFASGNEHVMELNNLGTGYYMLRFSSDITTWTTKLAVLK